MLISTWHFTNQKKTCVNNRFPTEEKQRFSEHQARKQMARSHKQADKTEASKNPKIVVATFDFKKCYILRTVRLVYSITKGN